MANRIAEEAQMILGAQLVDGVSDLIVFTNSWNTCGEIRTCRGLRDCPDLRAAESIIMHACDRARVNRVSDANARLRSL